jgi:hypothetical protein
LTVADMLEKLGDLYRQRNSLYGDNYKRTGRRMLGYFPDGIHLRTQEDFNRFSLFVHMDGKMSRYAQAMLRGEGHVDSLDDLSVYSQMQQEVDREPINEFGTENALMKALDDLLHEVSCTTFINGRNQGLLDAETRARQLVEYLRKAT